MYVCLCSRDMTKAQLSPGGFMGMEVGLDFHLSLAHPTYPRTGQVPLLG